MAALPLTLPARAGGAARASNSSCRRLRFSTSGPLRAGGGPLFNLGGLGASREADYLSRERGIPRAEFSSNVHLIRSSEVDPFAPAPGSARSAPAAAGTVGAREAPGDVACLAAQLRALRGELEDARRGWARVAALQARRESSRRLGAVVALSAAICAVVGYLSYGPGERQLRAASAQALVAEQAADKAKKAQRQRGAPREEQVLAESGLTRFESGPAAPRDHTGGSFLGGLFWARAPGGEHVVSETPISASPGPRAETS